MRIWQSRFIVWFVFVSLVLIGGISCAGAASLNEFGLDSNGAYDIYFGGPDNLVVLKNVQIVGLRQVQLKNFLVIQTDSFAGRRSEGLVSLEHVQAIVVSHGIVPLKSGKEISIP